MSYEYKNPTEEGYRQVQLPRYVHNILFPNRATRWCHRYEYYMNGSSFRMHRFTNVLGVVVLFLLYPLNMLVSGLGNYKQINKEYGQLLNQKEAGSFTSDVVHDKNILGTIEEAIR